VKISLPAGRIFLFEQDDAKSSKKNVVSIFMWYIILNLRV
ncbi:MAG: hypothetical protein ACI8WW_002805, partial [Oceanospirillaceae bacterium]